MQRDFTLPDFPSKIIQKVLAWWMEEACQGSRCFKLGTLGGSFEVPQSGSDSSFPLLSFRLLTPCVKVIFMNTGWLETLWSSLVDVFILPVYHSVSKCGTSISVRLTREWKTFPFTIFHLNLSSRSRDTGTRCGGVVTGRCAFALAFYSSSYFLFFNKE